MTQLLCENGVGGWGLEAGGWGGRTEGRLGSEKERQWEDRFSEIFLSISLNIGGDRESERVREGGRDRDTLRCRDTKRQRVKYFVLIATDWGKYFLFSMCLHHFHKPAIRCFQPWQN